MPSINNQGQAVPQPDQQSQPQPPVRRSWRSRIKSSLRARWPGYPIIILLIVVSWLTGHFKSARNRFFVERDPTLSYPFNADTVPSWSLAFIGAAGPLFLIILTQVLIRRSPRGIYFDKRTKDIHLAIIVLCEVLSVTWLITNILKVYVGRLRPNFFAYCDYKGYRNAVASGDLTTYLANTVPGQMGDLRFCADPALDAHFSFPSGHSSISFCGLTFLTLFMLHVTSRIEFRHHAVGKAIRLFIVLIPLFSAAIVAASRVIDYRHNVEDTVWGALIGILSAFLAFHANYAYARTNLPGIPVTGGSLQPQNFFSMTPYQNHSVVNENYDNAVDNVNTVQQVPPQVEMVPTTRGLLPQNKITPHSPLVTRSPRVPPADSNV